MTQRSITTARRHLHCIAASGAFLLALHSTAPPATAQLIGIRTLPIADGDQFGFFPGANFGMGLTIAVPDTVHDPFVNPSKGSRMRQSYFFGAPTSFTVSRRAGKGTTVPLGVFKRSGSTFGGAALAIQRLTDGRRIPTQILTFEGARPLPADSPAIGPPVEGTADAEVHTNSYGFFTLGHDFAKSRVSLGASLLWSGLDAVDGVNLRYPDSRRVRQSGGSADIRIGALKEWDRGAALEALVVHHRVGVSQDVSYADRYWDPIQRTVIERGRVERERERTQTWGLHLGYQRPLSDSTWRVGAIVTANVVRNPSTPQYEITSVYSDEGRASALNFGVGVARSRNGTTIGLDAIYEPIVNHLWGIADSAAASSSAIVLGARTLENEFRFSNAIVRAGVGHVVALDAPGTALRLQVGLEARSTAYTLEQRDLIRDADRTAHESWIEWTRTWAVAMRLATVEFQYRGRLTTGGSRPGVSFIAVPPIALSSSIAPFPGPSNPTTLNGVNVTSHQVSVSLPLR
jgi:hypothetical protein